MHVPDEVATSLAGRSFVLVGISRELALEVGDILEEAGVAWATTPRADPANLRNFDLAICDVDAVNLAQTADPPQLIVGSMDSLAVFRPDSRSPRDFIVAPPLRADELLLRAYRLLQRDREPGVRTTGNSGKAPVVIAADDDPTTTAIVRAVVTQGGMSCLIASDGKQAIELSRSLRPDVIILDVNMPFHDGFEVLSALRNDSRTVGVPVVMLTSVQQESDVVRGFGLGADDYVVKPFNPLELMARIKRLVNKTPAS